MSIETKTGNELAEEFLANIEGEINQDTPAVDQSFNVVLSGNQALFVLSLIKFGQQRALQNLATTAFGQGLVDIATEYGVQRKDAQEAVLNISLPAVNGTVIPATAIFTGDNNGEQYFPDNPATAAGGVALLTITAENPGANGNLEDSDTLTIDRQIAGAETTATVLSTQQVGAEEEEEILFQRRVLLAIRKKSGGENSGDVREFAEEVSGVAAGYPYTGRAFDDLTTSQPPDRTMYVEATSDIDPEGIAPPALLDAVRTALLINPETGRSRETLGMTDEFLFVRSIRRTIIFVEIRGLMTPSGQLTQIEDAIETSLIAYFFNLRPFILGVDVEEGRNDRITDLSVSDVVQDVLKGNNSSATGVGFGFSVGVFEAQHVLADGELTKLDPAGPSYAP